MTRRAQNRLAIVLAGIAVAGLAATWAVGKAMNEDELTRLEKHEVTRMTEKMKTVCAGRVLIDMPAEAQVAITHANIDGFGVAAFSETNEEFERRVAAREMQIKSKPDRLGGSRNMETERDVESPSGLSGKIFVHSRTVTEGTASNGLELERYRYEGISVEALLHAGGLSIDLSASDYDPARIENLSRLVAQLVPNAGNQIPAEFGFCIDRAYFRDPIEAEQHEQIIMLTTLPSRPDIDFMLILAAGIAPDQNGLLARDAAAEDRLSLFEKMRMTKLRAGTRTISGLPGEEVIRAITEENDAVVHNFWWEMGGTKDKVSVPHIVFKMNTGNGDHGPVPPSLSERVAIELWDTISSSIRLHAPAHQHKVQAEAVPIAIGSHAWAGERCPQSGWWLCSDGDSRVEVLGGQRQYLRKGQKMPQALLLPPQSWWQKVRGLQSSYENQTRTEWQLVDKREHDRTPSPVPLAEATVAAQADNISAIKTERSHASPEPAIGFLARTGMQCPASGWWRCEESHALDGTRWFAARTLLPPATFKIPPAAFGRTFGKAQAIQRRSVWLLVRHDLTSPAESDSRSDTTGPSDDSNLPVVG